MVDTDRDVGPIPLKAIGVGIAIDDFGTRYSSRIASTGPGWTSSQDPSQLPGGMTQRREDAAVVASVIGFARTLGVRTIAEGIEGDAQIPQLASLECDFGQGSRWSPPVSGAEAARLVAGGC